MSTLKLKYTIEFIAETDTEYYPPELKTNDPDGMAKYEEDNSDIHLMSLLLETAMEDISKSRFKIKVTPRLL